VIKSISKEVSSDFLPSSRSCKSPDFSFPVFLLLQSGVFLLAGVKVRWRQSGGTDEEGLKSCVGGPEGVGGNDERQRTVSMELCPYSWGLGRANVTEVTWDLSSVALTEM
jgi:hypothetical protein